MSELDYDYIRRQYVEQERSLSDIAAELGVGVSRVRRVLLRQGVALRNRSQAQRAALSSGRHPHPTRGRKRDEQTRQRISAGRARAWKELSDEQRQRLVELARQQWQQMSGQERAELLALARQAVLASRQKGSKLELYLLAQLYDRGLDVRWRGLVLTSGGHVQVDLELPGRKVAVEVLGPGHYLPLWGELALQRTRRADQRKASLLCQAGYRLVRIKNLAPSLSLFGMCTVLGELLAVLASENGSRVVELEVPL